MITVFGSLMDLFCQFRGHPGNIKQIINLINFSMFSRTFFLPLLFIFKVINFAPIFFYILLSIVIFTWQSLVIIQGISEIHHTEFSESLLIYLFPFRDQSRSSKPHQWYGQISYFIKMCKRI